MNVQQRVPSRLKPFETCQLKTPLWARLLLGRELAPTRPEYESLGEGLSQGDPLMDTVIEAAFASGGVAEVFANLKKHRFLAPDSAASAQTMPPALQGLFASAANPPFTVDWATADEGAKFIHRTGTLATDVLRDMALMGGYLLSAFNQTLVLTGDFERGAAFRLSNTAHWWLTVTHCGANRPAAAGFQETLRVRCIHAMVRRQLVNHPQWDQSLHGIPINQVDMAATYLGFSSVMLLGLRKSGIYVSQPQARAVMHLWKVIAWQMGVSAHWLVDTEEQAAVRLRQFMMTHTPPDDTTRRLARALAQEPLSRRYGVLESARRRFAYLSHLSSSAWLLGTNVMGDLGVSSPLGPWLKALETIPHAAAFYLHSSHDALRLRSVRQGRAAQCRAVAQLRQKSA